MKQRVPRLMLAASSSGAGKTTVTCAVLQALHNRGVKVASFKCGPDYIDPMFHKEALGIPAHNLDLFLSSGQTVCHLLCENRGEHLSLMEGVMGYYDGVAMTQQASSYHLARETQTPAVLIVDCKGMAASIAALILGFLNYQQDSGIKGVILNRLAPSLYPELKALIRKSAGLKVYGYLPNMVDCSLESRHLGLIPAGEVEQLKEKLQRLARQAEQTIDLDGLLDLADSALLLSLYPVAIPAPVSAPVRVGVAMDQAFCFYYDENLSLLRKLGAELIPFSPMCDTELPKQLDGLLFGGGYPEVFAECLAANPIRKEIRQELEKGKPCIAECGGFQYLQETIEGQDGKIWEMVGFLPYHSFRAKGLHHFGYATLTAKKPTILCPKEAVIPVHEFHRWDSTGLGDAFRAEKKRRGMEWDCVVAEGNLFAGYPHLYYYSDPRMARRFLDRCLNCRQK